MLRRSVEYNISCQFSAGVDLCLILVAGALVVLAAGALAAVYWVKFRRPDGREPVSTEMC